MKFPEVERVIYEKNPLAEVVCQCMFPRVLAIDEGIPATFQREMGPNYPFVETREVVSFSMNLPGELSPAKRVHYLFSTEDRRFTVALSSEFIAISTSNYKQWAEFKTHIEAALEALAGSYAVPIFTRIGLRYIDVVSKEDLGLGDCLWKDLFRSSALGLFGEDDIKAEALLEMTSVTALALDDVGKAQIRTSFSRSLEGRKNLSFTIDSDFFEENPVKGTGDAIRVLSEFNKDAGRAFRWFITERLHDALGPVVPSKS